MKRSGKKYHQYKGIKKYKEIVSLQEEIENKSNLLISNPNFKTEINFLSNEIEIKEDWILKIEFYLPYLSAAINENRRFILSEGETYDIEKVKKVSKDSVYDLAKHTDKINNIKENGDVEPKKLYVIEKNDDYSLYENRFLVFLINLLKSFINVRFDHIKDAYSKREIISKMDNGESYGDGLFFNFEICDVKHNDFKLEENDINLDKINRINAISSQVSRLSNTELIKLVSKSAPLMEPIIKNNVIKNDPNFIKCYELYEYLKSYKDDGFTRKESYKKEELNKDSLTYFKYIPYLLSFLSYASINNTFSLLEDELKKENEEKLNFSNNEKERILNEYLLNNISNDDIKNKVVELFNENKKLIKTIEEERKVNEVSFNELKNKSNQEINSLKKEIERSSLIINQKENEYKIKEERIKESYEGEIARLKEEMNLINAENKALKLSLGKKELKKDNLSIDEFDSLEKEFDALFEYVQKNWKQVRHKVDSKKKNEIKEKFKKKRDFNGK